MNLSIQIDIYHFNNCDNITSLTYSYLILCVTDPSGESLAISDFI